MWILAPLAPALYVKALAPFELVHDRFLYAPLVGFCIAAALVLGVATQWIEERLHCRVLPLVAVVLVLLLSIESLKQMMWWQNNMTLFTRAVAVTPNNPRALGGLADANLALGRYDEAARLLQQALVIDPQRSTAMFALGRIAWLRGDDDTAEKYFVQALSIQPRYDMWLHLASVEMHRNQVDKAEAAVRQALAMNSTGAGAHAALGTILLAKGDRAAAAGEFQARVAPVSAERGRAGGAGARHRQRSRQRRRPCYGKRVALIGGERVILRIANHDGLGGQHVVFFQQHARAVPEISSAPPGLGIRC